MTENYNTVKEVDIAQHKFKIGVDKEPLWENINQVYEEYSGRLDTDENRDDVRRAVLSCVLNNTTIEPKYDANDVNDEIGVFYG